MRSARGQRPIRETCEWLPLFWAARCTSRRPPAHIDDRAPRVSGRQGQRPGPRLARVSYTHRMGDGDSVLASLSYLAVRIVDVICKRLPASSARDSNTGLYSSWTTAPGARAPAGRGVRIRGYTNDTVKKRKPRPSRRGVIHCPAVVPGPARAPRIFGSSRRCVPRLPGCV